MGDSMWSDIRVALRSLRARPAFALLVIFTLALGIGANTAIFSAVDGLLLRPAPFAEPDRLVRITSVRGDADRGALSLPEFDDLRALPIVDDAALYTDQGMYNASGFGTPEELESTITTHNLFRVLGVEPLVGSTFPPAFDRTRNFGLVISHGLWVRKFGRAPDIVGRTMTLDGAPGYTIYGVMPPAFNFPSHSDLFRSSGIAADPAFYRRRDVRDRFVVARLKSGVTVDQARAAMNALAERLQREFPESNAGVRFRVTPLSEMYTATIRPYILLLFAAVALVLIVACANVTNLLLSRAIARDRELAVRTALGASRWRLVRQALTESVVLSVLAALFAGAFAVIGVRVITGMVPVPLPGWMQIAVDARVAMFLGITAVLTGIAAGLVPALRSHGQELQGALKDGSRGSSDGLRHGRMRNVLVVAEVALAFVLLVGASLLVQSVWRLRNVNLGFNTANALTFRVELGWAAYTTLEKTVTFHRHMLDELAQLPEVQAVTFDNNLPMSGKPRDPHTIRAGGQSADQEAANPYVNLHLVGPNYFAVMGIPIGSGRAFNDGDRPDTTPVVIISQTLAERLWPGKDAVGQRIQMQTTTPSAVWLTVVGVAAAVLHHELEREPGFDIYRPYTQVSTAGPYYVIRTTGDPMSIARTATAIVGRIDPNQSFLDVHTFDRRVTNRIWQRRVAGALFASFAALALVLACVGLYGVLSHLVTQQTREIGVRVALGASSRDVTRMVLARGIALAAAGVAVGVVFGLGLARLVGAMLYQVSPADPLTFITVPPLLLCTAALACYLPARRATRVDPLVALRAE
jgi:putative ABC transport system permease protein